MDSINELSAAGYVHESLEVLKSTKESYGQAVEEEIARRKLEQIKNPQTDSNSDRDNDPFVDTLIDKVVGGSDLFFNFAKKDYGESLPERPQTEDAIDQLRGKLQESVWKDWRDTNKQYENLPYNPENDPTVIAKNNAERGLIREAAQLLGFKIQEKEPDHITVIAPSRTETQGNIDDVIKQRINIGIQNLFDDYRDSHGEIRRPVLRQVVTLADQMARSLRSSSQ
jgi:hypothetical protein